MPDPHIEAARASVPVHDLLADETLRRSAVFRWRIWMGRPLVRPSSNGDANRESLPRDIAPYRFPINVIRGIGCFLFAATLSLVIWGLAPFLVMWGVGAVLGHSAPYTGGMTGVLGLLVIAVGVTTLVLSSELDDARRHALEWTRASYAGLALPVLMYLTASGGAGDFTIFNQPLSKTPDVRLWLAFYSYMYLDIISFGAIESLVGELTSLRPASFTASLFTFLTQFMMTASILFHAFKYFTRRVFATEEFSGTFPQLLTRLNDVAPAGQRCYVLPLYVEQRLAATPLPTPANELFELSQRDVRINVSKQFRSANWQFLKPGIVLQVVVIAVTSVALILALLPLGTLGAMIVIAAVLGGLTIGIVLPGIARARRTAEVVRCGSQLRQLGQACLVYASERGRFPASLEELVELEGSLEPALLCPTVSRKQDLASGRSPTTRAEALRTTRYVYVADGRRASTASADEPLIYEQPDAHDGRGGNVLYSDGSVQWVNAQELEKLAARAAG
jgi:prepilin-type processing-associated H-X9-DG protein